jgi:HPt (histidine-containing phosphotransfer) domain-containing protein
MGEEPLDRARLEEVSGGLEGLSEELIQLFLDDAGPRQETIRAAVEQGDADGVRREAHSLKGASSNVGATAMERVSRELEEAGRSGDLSDAGRLAAELGTELGRVRTALESGLS